MRVEFSSAASDEFLAALDYYEAESPDLGAAFVDDVEHAVRLISTFPSLGSPGPDATRRVHLCRFSFALVYLETQRQLADTIAVPYQRVNEIVNGRRGVTPSTALRLSQYFGTSSDFWLNLQLAWDLYHARQSEAKVLKKIPRYAGGRGAKSPV